MVANDHPEGMLLLVAPAQPLELTVFSARLRRPEGRTGWRAGLILVT